MRIQRNPLRGATGANAPVLNIAHRGARAFAPENTLAAFEKAHELGSDMFELDVHLSRDDELIVHHDDTLVRCTDATTRFPRRSSYFVSDFDLSELAELDAGSWFAAELELSRDRCQPFLRTLSAEELTQHIDPAERERFRSGRIRLPTLQEALELAHGTGMMVNIEIKTIPRMYPRIAEKVVRLVRSMAFEHRVLISSFDHEQLQRVRTLSDTVATAILTSDRLAKPADYLRLLDADAYNPGCYDDYDSLGFGSVRGKLDPGGIQQVRKARRRVNVWTCNDEGEMRKLIQAGVTGLISDYPNRIGKVLQGRRLGTRD